MAWKIWKPTEERLRQEWDKAISLRNQGKWNEASEHLLKVSELADRAPDPESKERGTIARGLAMLYLAVQARTAQSWNESHNALSRIRPDTVLEIPYKATAKELAEESMIFSQEYSLPAIKPGDHVADAEETARRFETVAQSYLTLGRENLTLGKLLGVEDNVHKRAFRCLGLSRTLVASSEEVRDPDKAVEYYSEAIGYLTQAGLEEYRSHVDERNRKLGSVAKCWFCGRNVQGEEIHYVPMDTLLTSYLRNKSATESPLPFKAEESKILTCRACYEAIRMLADKIAEHYHRMAIAAIHEMEQRLQAQVSSMEQHLNNRMNRIEAALGRVR